MVTAVLGGLLRALLHDPTDRPERGLCVESGRLISYTRYARGYPFPVITVVIAAARRMHITVYMMHRERHLITVQ